MIKKHPLLTRWLHWITALIIIALFVSGWYMVELDYYSNWYQTLPELHILVGLVLTFLWIWVLLRLFRIKSSSLPLPHKPLEQLAAKVVKSLFYLLVLLMVTTGYLMATGQGEPLLLFNVIKIPALSHFTATQIDTIGWLHEYTAYLLMILVFIHTIGALKHHFIDKDATLKRMI